MSDPLKPESCFLKPGLTPERAQPLCLQQCRAQCCRGPQFLRLTDDEVTRLKRHADALGLRLTIHAEADGGSIRFLEYANDCCPMLDDATSRCRIYDERPQRCRAFPEGPRPGCLISTDAP